MNDYFTELGQEDRIAISFNSIPKPDCILVPTRHRPPHTDSDDEMEKRKFSYKDLIDLRLSLELINTGGTFRALSDARQPNFLSQSPQVLTLQFGDGIVCFLRWLQVHETGTVASAQIGSALLCAGVCARP